MQQIITRNLSAMIQYTLLLKLTAEGKNVRTKQAYLDFKFNRNYFLYLLISSLTVKAVKRISSVVLS